MAALRYVPATTHDDVQALPGLLETLRATPPPEDGVLSVYLATPLVPVAGRAYLLSFQEGCRSLRASLGPEVPAAFERAVAQAAHHLAEAFVPRAPGLALFASGQADYFYAAPLPTRPAEEFAWGPRPALAPLAELLDAYERVAVVLFDRRRARIFTVFLGAIEEQQTLEDEEAGSPPARRPGGTAETHYAFRAGQGGDGAPQRAARGGVAETRLARYQEGRAVRHARRTGHALMTLLRTHRFDRLLLAGPEEPLALLRAELPRPLRARLAGDLSLATDASEAEVLRAAVQAAEAIERQAEVEMVDRLVEAAITPRATLGHDATLAALSDHRVYHLFLADTFAAVGAECPRCGRLVPGPGPCPACGAATTGLGDLRERVVERALEQGARVETVSGDAASLLTLHGGLGALTRY